MYRFLVNDNNCNNDDSKNYIFFRNVIASTDAF